MRTLAKIRADMHRALGCFDAMCAGRNDEGYRNARRALADAFTVLLLELEDDMEVGNDADATM